MANLLIVAFISGILVTVVGDRLFCRLSPHPGAEAHKPSARKIVYKASSYFLLVRIGFVGGAEIASTGIDGLWGTGVLCTFLSVSLFFISFFLLSRFTSLDRETRACWSAHQGSVSVGTFAATLAFLAEMKLVVDPLSTAWLILMEVPAIVVATRLANRQSSLKQVLLNRSILVLFGSLVIGYLTSSPGLHAMEPVFEGGVFESILIYFLFEMGRQAGSHIRELGSHGKELVVFGIGMPLLGGTLGAAAGTLVGLTLGDVAMLSTLCASASYVAATAVMEGVVQKKSAVATSLAASLGVTLPFNLLVGLRLYLWEGKVLAQWQAGEGPAAWILLATILGVLGLVILGARRQEQRENRIEKQGLAEELPTSVVGDEAPLSAPAKRTDTLSTNRALANDQPSYLHHSVFSAIMISTWSHNIQRPTKGWFSVARAMTRSFECKYSEPYRRPKSIADSLLRYANVLWSPIHGNYPSQPTSRTRSGVQWPVLPRRQRRTTLQEVLG